MRKILLPLTLGALLAMMSMTAFAGDYADLRFIGFSANGRYMAFEESGVWDGSGGEYAYTYYIDVEANKYALQATKFERSMDEMKESVKRPLYNRYKLKVAGALNRLKIVRGNTGQQVVAHLLTDWTYVKPATRDSYFIDPNGNSTDRPVTDYAGGMLMEGAGTEKVIFGPVLYAYTQNTTDFYELTLTSSAATKVEGCSEGLRFEMTLQDNTHHRDLPLQVLQKDGPSVPASRNCPYGYHIEQVYFYKDRLAVFVNMFSQGFEGPDMRYMAVTGLLEYESIPRG